MINHEAPTIQDIAMKAGVSTATVSRALRNDSRISAATTKTIHDIATKVGYRPNPLISVLMSHLRTTKPTHYQSTLAYLDTSFHPDETERWQSSKQYFDSICKRADQLGYGVDRFWFHDPDVLPNQLVKILANRGIQGMIVHYLPTPHNQLHDLPIDLGTLAVAAVGSKMDAPSIHYACTDHFEIMKLAFANLQSLGYKRIGVAIESYVDNITEGRILGAYLKAQQTVLAQNRTEHFITDKYSRDNFVNWFQRAKPDAVICIDSQIFSWLKELRVKVPEEVGVAHLDLPDDLPDLSGIRQLHEAIGAAAVDLIVGQLHHNERGIPKHPRATLVAGEWFQGKTVRKLSARSGAASPKVKDRK